MPNGGMICCLECTYGRGENHQCDFMGIPVAPNLLCRGFRLPRQSHTDARAHWPLLHDLEPGVVYSIENWVGGNECAHIPVFRLMPVRDNSPPNVLKLTREQARALGHETVAILRRGEYLTQTGDHRDIRTAVAKAREQTLSYPPEHTLPVFERGLNRTDINVCNETTLAAVTRLRAQGTYPVALNMASATSPGGGFLSGARAQEEYLARSSGLYMCLHGNKMYDFHRSAGDPFYSDYVIYSPDVPIIRGDDGKLLTDPYVCSILTSPAVYASRVREFQPNRLPEIATAMKSRILKVLAIAAEHRHDALVLGAWGCGAFGNDGTLIAEIFRDCLYESFESVFKCVVFAIADWSEDRRFIGPFERAFHRT